MHDACRYVDRPFAFIFRYVRLRTFSHAVIVAAVLAAVACSVTTQYGVKYLVDTLASGLPPRRVASGWRFCSWFSLSRPTIFCGGWPAGSRVLRSCASPVICAATCSAT